MTTNLCTLRPCFVVGILLLLPLCVSCFSGFRSRVSTTASLASQVLADQDKTSAAVVKIDADILAARIDSISTIASDVDGTLLSSDHTLSSRTRRVIERAVNEASKPNGNIQHFFPATGKSRNGALNSLGSEMREILSKLPGVFIQGLYCVDADGSVIFEKKLPKEATIASEAIAARFNATIIGNYEDAIYCNTAGDPQLLDEVNSLWGEPVPIPVDSLANDGPQFHKLVFMSNDVDMLRDDMRPELELLAKENGATVTTSFPTVLEILPEGCSKALGVRKLCEKLGVDPGKELLALGDAENDKEMLEMACIGVAMGNASPVAKAAADIELVETSSQGGAGLAMERYSKLGSEEEDSS